MHRHIKIAVGRDFKDCTPVKGTYKREHLVTNWAVSVIITTDKTKNLTKIPKVPMYIRENNPSIEEILPQSNSYRMFLEMQQQQQQQQ